MAAEWRMNDRGDKIIGKSDQLGGIAFIQVRGNVHWVRGAGAGMRWVRYPRVQNPRKHSLSGLCKCKVR